MAADVADKGWIPCCQPHHDQNCPHADKHNQYVLHIHSFPERLFAQGGRESAQDGGNQKHLIGGQAFDPLPISLDADSPAVIPTRELVEAIDEKHYGHNQRGITSF